MENIYWVEEKTEPMITRRWYAWYKETLIPVAVLFDVCESRSQADQAIADHKAGTHATQFRPE
jgi:hypothetical protein